jgi:hypothetical protein
MLTDFERQQLTNQSECYIHTHARSPLDQTSVSEIEAAAPVKPVTTATYSLTAADEHISIAQTCTVTLPVAANGKEYRITLISTGDTLTIVPTGTDTVVGTTSVVVTVQWTSLHFKADTANNWVII